MSTCNLADPATAFKLCRKSAVLIALALAACSPSPGVSVSTDVAARIPDAAADAPSIALHEPAPALDASPDPVALDATADAVFDAGAPDAAPALAPRCAGFSGFVWELGDSITYGKGGTKQAGYRPELATWMVDGCPVAFTGTAPGPEGAHDGHPGFDLQQIRDVVAHNYSAHQHVGAVSLIILMAGANNMDTVTPYDPVATPALYAALLDDVSVFPETRIVVTTVTPHQAAVAEARIVEFNAKLPAIWDAWDARHPGNRLIRADQHRALGGVWSAALFSDVVHMNPAGYTKMANEWIRALAGR